MTDDGEQAYCNVCGNKWLLTKEEYKEDTEED
jgi:hypothetical protein